MVRQNIGPVAALKRVVTVDRLPKTRSGKILRATIKKIIDGEQVAVPSTIEDPAVLAEIERAVQRQYPLNS
jgi:propionyl-CoA synthetase